MTLADLIVEQVEALPETLAREVLDFATFLRLRLERREYADLIAAQSISLAPVWDNVEDEIWNEL